jgi:hypothetical protein
LKNQRLICVWRSSKRRKANPHLHFLIEEKEKKEGGILFEVSAILITINH